MAGAVQPDYNYDNTRMIIVVNNRTWLLLATARTYIATSNTVGVAKHFIIETL